MSNIAEEIIKMLSPVIGTGLATSVVQMQCRKMGLVAEDISQENIEEFAERFKKPLEIFAGEDIAIMVIQKIQEIK